MDTFEELFEEKWVAQSLFQFSKEVLRFCKKEKKKKQVKFQQTKSSEEELKNKSKRFSLGVFEDSCLLRSVGFAVGFGEVTGGDWVSCLAERGKNRLNSSRRTVSPWNKSLTA
jgi:hypothetical protein